jgi:xylulokinase
MSLMGIDIGTTGSKAVVFSSDGKILSTAYRTYPELFPKPGWVEMDPNRMWTAVTDVIKEASTLAKADPVQAVGVAVLGEAITPIGSDLKPLYNSLPSVDARCFAQVDWWDKTVGKERLYQITGQPLHTSYSVNKVLWLRDEMPEIFQKTWKFLLWEDLFCCWMGLKPSIEHSLASRTMLFDIHKRSWSDELMNQSSLTPDLFAEVVTAGDHLGEIPNEKAKGLGLGKNVVVTIAGHDAINGAFGAGVIDTGQAVLTIGTTESIVVALEKPMLTQHLLENMHACYCHVYPERYVALAYSTCSGNLLRWFKECFGERFDQLATESGKDVYDVLVDSARLGKSGLLLLPHFVGAGTPYLDPNSRGAILGLDLSTQPEDLIAAILEGTTYELKMNLLSLEKAEISIDRMYAVGGGAKSNRWLQLKADITGKPIIRLDITESGCLGAAIQAGIACGLFSTREEALKKLVNQGQRFDPDPNEGEQYEEAFQLYQEIYHTVKPISKTLININPENGEPS